MNTVLAPSARNTPSDAHDWAARCAATADSQRMMVRCGARLRVRPYPLGSMIAGVVVDLVGLVPGTAPSDVAPEVAAQLGLVQGCTLLVLVSASLATLSRYDLTREVHQGIRQRLDERAAANTNALRSPE